MRTVAIIQARMGSTRLPGKALREIEGATMLARVVRRVQRTVGLHDIIVATTIDPPDAAIVAECKNLGVLTFLGNAEDVLDRYHRAAKAFRAEAVVRITSDCPLLDPEVAGRVVAAFVEGKADYASNTLRRTYPRGLDVEVMTVAALIRAWNEAAKPEQRTHVTPYIYQNADLFRLLSVTSNTNYSGYRWTVDTHEDLAFARAIYARLGPGDDFGWREVVELVRREPGLMDLNRGIRQKALEEC